LRRSASWHSRGVAFERFCRLQWIRDDPDRLALEVEAPDRAFVVIADADFPGWTCSLDGRPVRIARVNHLVRGVIVPAGLHRLEMHYLPDGWAAGQSTTRAALAFALAAALGWNAVRSLARLPAARRRLPFGGSH
jgi:hypothetical protein